MFCYLIVLVNADLVSTHSCYNILILVTFCALIKDAVKFNGACMIISDVPIIADNRLSLDYC